MKCLYIGGHRLFREALRAALGRFRIDLVPVASLTEALDELDRDGDVRGALVDADGFEDEHVLEIVTSLLRKRSELNCGAVSESRSPVLPAEIIRAGAMAFLSKDTPLRELRFSLSRMLDGHLVVDPVVARPLFGFLDGAVDAAHGNGNGNGHGHGHGNGELHLTPVERRVLALSAEGKLNKQIARELDLSPLTVKNHLARIRSRLDAGTTTHAVAMALRAGALD